MSLDFEVASAVANILDNGPKLENKFLRTAPNPETLRKLQPFLAYRPIEVIKRTLECTTRMANVQVQLPLWRHLKARFPFMNVKHLGEVVSTDTYFSSVPDVSGANCAQCFFGTKTLCIHVYGMKSKGKMSERYQDFITEQGAPLMLQ